MKIEAASVVSNRQIAKGLWRMEMEAPEIATHNPGPGQFINISVDDSWQLPLRRPMSIAGIHGSTLSIIYKLFGEGTTRLSRRKPGERISVLGPLGNTFELGDSGEQFPVLVGGGVGIAPILWLHQVLEKKRVSHDLIIGAVTGAEHFMEHEPGRGIILTTDDGSKGEPGTVMPTLEKLSSQQSDPAIFACGPEAMLKTICAYVSSRYFPCQMALESYMGCGTGICQGCVIRLKNDSREEHSYGRVYSLVCRDGPVYDPRAVEI